MSRSLLFFIIIVSVKLNAQYSINWENTTTIATSHFGNNHPRISCNNNGEAYIVWGRTSDESLQFSIWNGTNFSTPKTLNKVEVATASWMGPDLASRDDTIYIVMKAVPEDDRNSHIYLTSSFDGGRNFNTPIKVDNIGTDISRFPTIAIDLDGNPIVAYMKFDSNFRDSRWVVTRSTDYGKTFQPDVKASGFNNSAEICDCCPGSLSCKEEVCILSYRDNNKNMRDNWIAISKNNGKSFDTGLNIDNNSWMISNCPASGPAVIIHEDFIFSSFMNGARNLFRNYYSKTSISQNKVLESYNLADNIQNLRIQNYPRIAGSDKSIVITGTQAVNTGTVQIPLWFTSDYTKGFNTSFQIVDELNISNVDVAINSNSIFVVWQDDNARTINFRKGSYSTLHSKHIPGNVSVQLINTEDQWIIQGESLQSIQIIDLQGRIISSLPKINSDYFSINKNSYFNTLYLLRINTSEGYTTLKTTK
ncbi:MAG: exo-alpha-sialidase [Saprospiraceae bacterium]|nr:exo-alpha-sialidase [Saprospiraceae bacterium]